MARIHSILQGFVDINLETDENVNTTIESSSATDQPGLVAPILNPISPLDSDSEDQDTNNSGFTFIDLSIGLSR